MKVKYETRTPEYRVLCPCCNQVGPWSISKEGAIRMATTAGFRLIQESNTFVCSRCVPVYEDDSLEVAAKRLFAGARFAKNPNRRRKTRTKKDAKE